MLGKSQVYALTNSGSTNYLSYRSPYRNDGKKTTGFTPQLTEREQNVLRGLTRIDETDDGKNDFLVTTRNDRQIEAKQTEDESLREAAAASTEVGSAVGNIKSSVAGSTDGKYKPKNLAEFLAKTYAEKNGLYEDFSADKKETGQNKSEIKNAFDLDAVNSLHIAPPKDLNDSETKVVRKKDKGLKQTDKENEKTASAANNGTPPPLKGQTDTEKQTSASSTTSSSTTASSEQSSTSTSSSSTSTPAA